MLIELGRSVRSSDTCRFVVLGEAYSLGNGNGGIKDFPDLADVIHWNEGKELDPLERSSDFRAQYFVLRNKVDAGTVPPYAL